MKKIKVTVIGGGTGTVTVLRGLKKFPSLDLSAIVTMTDSGGSTGRLRDEFGMLPVGDVRQCIVALAREEAAGKLLRELFLYRFPDSKSSLSGHNFGNILLTALTQILGSEIKAIEAASEILNIKGKVLPITQQNADLIAEYSNGDILYGEKNIDETPENHDGTTKVIKLWTQPKATIDEPAKMVIEESDFVIIGPGDLYSSLLSNFVVEGAKEAMKKSRAKLIYITNLMSKFGQTHAMKQSNFIAEVKNYTGRMPDKVIINKSNFEDEILNLYKEEKSFLIEDDVENSDNIIRKNLVSSEIIKRISGDTVRRSLIRHDSRKLAKLLYDIINNY